MEDDETIFQGQMQKLQNFIELYQKTNHIDKVVNANPVYFQNKIYFQDTVVSTGKIKGTTFGNAKTEKLAFYGQLPIPQQGAIPTPSGGGVVDSQARTAIVSIIKTLKNLGLIA